MAIDTLAYCKALEAAGVDRKAAEAQAGPLVNHVLPDLATKADLATLRADLEHAFQLAIERSENRMTVRLFGMMLGIVGLMNGILFALLRIVH